MRQANAGPVLRRGELVDEAVTHRITPREQRAARRRATRRDDVELGATNSLARELINPRRLDLLVSITAEIAVADVVDI